MKYLPKIIILTAIIFAGSLIEIAAQTYGNSKTDAQKVEVTPTDDLLASREMERAVFKRLLRLPYYGVFDHIGFEIKGDTVNLTGKVANARNKKDAERAIRRVAGVKNVVNQIEMLPPSVFDNRIRRRTFRELSARGLFRYLQEPNPSVRIIVDRGHIELEGYVANRGDYNLANILARGVSDAFSVKNNLVVENGEAR